MSAAGLYLETATSVGVDPGEFLADVAAAMRARMSFRAACSSSVRSDDGDVLLGDGDGVELIIFKQI